MTSTHPDFTENSYGLLVKENLVILKWLYPEEDCK